MKARVTQATLRRLEQLEKPKVTMRGRYLFVPKLMDLDEWEKLATVQQTELIRKVRE